MQVKQPNICVRCPDCDWRIFDKVTLTSGVIAIKCPKCRKVVKVDLSLRRSLKLQLTNNK